MTAKQTVPLESLQQVINETDRNMILTSSILGLPETYIYEYKRENKDKIIAITKMHEMRTQITLAQKADYEKLKGIKMDELDTLFYIESELVKNLCDQLIDSKLKNTEWSQSKKQKRIAYIKELREYIIKNQQNFYLALNQQYRSQYEKYIYLEHLKQIMEENYDWQWGIMNIDQPIENAERLQKCIKEIIRRRQLKPSRVLLTAYDPTIQSATKKGSFRILKLNEKMNYSQLVEQALLILYHLYPRLRNKAFQYNIKKAITSPALQLLYDMKNNPTVEFMDGIRDFYELCNGGEVIRLTELKCFSRLYDCIQQRMNGTIDEDNKKPKLYL